jgi:hypothetical protein
MYIIACTLNGFRLLSNFFNLNKILPKIQNIYLFIYCVKDNFWKKNNYSIARCGAWKGTTIFSKLWVCRASYTGLCMRTRRVFGFLRIMAMNLKSLLDNCDGLFFFSNSQFLVQKATIFLGGKTTSEH